MGLYGNTVKDARNDVVSIVNEAIESGDIKAGGGTGGGTAGAAGPAGPAGPAGQDGADGTDGTTFTPVPSGTDVSTNAKIVAALITAGIMEA